VSEDDAEEGAGGAVIEAAVTRLLSNMRSTRLATRIEWQVFVD
jgi:hypothetical protein